MGKELTVGTQVILSIIVLIAWEQKNKMKLDQQGWFSNLSAVYQMLSTVFMIALVVYISPSLSDSEFVFTRYNNDTGFEGSGSLYYICLMGVLMSLYGLSGYESGAALSEETQDAGTAAPRGMIEAVVASCVTGFIFIVGLLYACQNQIESVLNGVTEQAVVNIFYQSFSANVNWTLFLTSVLLLNIFLAGFAHMTVTTRITYALVRDHALPGSAWMNVINPKTHNPDRVTFVVLILDASLCLLPLFSTTAFTAITQITTIGFQISYGLPIALRLYQHLFQPDKLKRGAFSLGAFSVPCQILSLGWLILTSVVLFFPQKIDPLEGITVDNFNYTGVVMIGTMIFAFAYWKFSTIKDRFKGPEEEENKNDPFELGNAYAINY